VKLRGLVSTGSGAVNEDAAGFVEQGGTVTAAWVFDGVTGINGRNYLDAPSDAAWVVARAQHHLQRLAAQDINLPQLLHELVQHLIVDWREASAGLDLPEDYDMPAACLLLVKRFADGWKALRLGDSFLLSASGTAVKRWDAPETDLGGLEELLRREARKLRSTGVTDFKHLLARFHPQLVASRSARNMPGNHAILLPDMSACAIPEYMNLGCPEGILLCTDGFYRAVDTYAMQDDVGLFNACTLRGGADRMLEQIRAVEAADPHCETHLRFKPADDASAVALHL
jgi:Protein phosphatase 2C